MARKITMTGRHAQYVEHRAPNATPDNDRDIRLEGEEAFYHEYAYGKPEQQAPPTQEPTEADADTEADVDSGAGQKRLTANGEYIQPMDESTLQERLRPLFFNNEGDVRLFLKTIAGMPPNDITDLVNRWVQDKRISDYGNSRKGVLWEILSDAGLYTRSRQNWNRRVY